MPSTKLEDMLIKTHMLMEGHTMPCLVRAADIVTLM